MKNIFYSEKLSDALKTINVSVVRDHYLKHLKKISDVDGDRGTIITTEFSTFEKIISSYSEEMIDTLFFGYQDNINIYWFSCVDDAIALQANSEQELIKLFDPKLMVLM